MARINTKLPNLTPPPRTHGGTPAVRISADQQLRRTVMACLLWEDNFYEDGQSVAIRIRELISKATPSASALLAVEARTTMNLRHVPLLICRELARHGHLTAQTLADVIQRPDELAEFVAICRKDGMKKGLTNQIKKGLAAAFLKFNEYSLAKYNRDGEYKLRDVLFLCHAKPDCDARAEMWKRLIDGKLAVPDTWEVALSTGADKKATWERLIADNKLGALALLRNLRNMEQAGVNSDIIRAGLLASDVRRVLPFRFIAAARHAPQYEPALEAKMLASLQESRKLGGKTILLVDVSGSMIDPLSAKSDMTRLDAACGLAIVAREICEDVHVISFSTHVTRVAPRRGFALRDAVVNSQVHASTDLHGAIMEANAATYDRLIVITDEQATTVGTSVPRLNSKAYMLNVAPYQNGVGYKNGWTHIDGFSEACVRYILEMEGAGD